MYRTILGILGLVILLVAAALIGPNFVDWNRHKDRIAAEVRNLTGHEVVIGGDIALTLLPRPRFSAKSVQVSGTLGDGGEPLVDLPEIQARLAWLPLLRGRFQLDSLILVEPVLRLEVTADGRTNWRLAREPGQGDQLGGGSGRIALGRFNLRGGTLIYRSAAGEQRVEGLDAEVTAGSLAGPFEASGAAVFEGVETRFSLTAGAYRQGRLTQTRLELSAPAIGTRLRFEGHTGLEPETQIRGKLLVEGDSLRQSAERLFGVEPPSFSAKPFVLDTTLEGNDAALQAADLAFELGGARLTGVASARAEDAWKLGVTLAATRLDLDALLRPAESAFAATSDAAPSPGQVWPIPNRQAFDLALNVEAADYRGEAIRDLTLRAAFDDDTLAISEASARLPGRSAVGFEGRWTDKDGPRLDGRLEANSDNLRRLAAWLGYSFEPTPPNRLRRLSLTTRISATGEELSLLDLEAELDLTKISGGLLVALRDRPGLGIGLMADRIDLDSYWPRAARDGGGVSEAEEPFVALLRHFDANVDLRVGSLAFFGTESRGVRIDGLLQDGTLTVREALAQSLAGGEARFSGMVSSLAGETTVDGELEIDAREPRQLAGLLGMDPLALARLGPLSMKSGFTSSAGGLSFEAAISGLGGGLDLTGQAKLDEAPVRLAGRFSLNHPDVSSWFDGAKKVESGSALQVKADFEATALSFVARDLAAELGDLSLGGKLAADLSRARPALAADLEGEVLTLDHLAGLLGLSDDAAGTLPEADLQLTLRFRELDLVRARLRNLALKAAYEPGLLRLLTASGEAYGGTVEMNGRIETAGRPSGELQLHAKNVAVRDLLGETLGIEGISGPIEMEAKLASRGLTEAQLISALSGDVRLAGRVALPPAGENGLRRPEDLRTLADGLAFVGATISGDGADLSGVIGVERGVLKARELQLTGEKGRLVIQATADLTRRRLDTRSELRRNGDGTEPYLALTVKGPLEEPDILLSGTAFESREAVEKDTNEPEPIADPAN